MARVIVGTAGHIDHGKSTLVRALTGTDPDRLPEEKKRGITIDLGYAFLEDVAAIIDVPGHEKLIRNMVAGAATIDYALLVIAADDGVMPQTAEHLQILRLLGVKTGALVLTKCAVVEPAWLDLVEEQVRAAVQNTFLHDAPLFRVDSLSGLGIPELRDFLLRELSRLPARKSRGVFRLPVDRVFQVKGRGTVVTGTILSGSVTRDTRLEALPGGFDIRVKRLESHGHEADTLAAGQRAALNLLGETEQLSRGRTLTVPSGLLSSSRLRVEIELLPGAEILKNRQRVRILIATQEALGRVQLLHRGDSGRLIANLLMEEEVVAVWQDRFVLRRYSPMETLGGGLILEPSAPRLRTRDLPAELELAQALAVNHFDSALHAFLRVRGRFGVDTSHVARVFGLTAEELETICRTASQTILRVGELLILQERFTELGKLMRQRLSELHRQSPQSPGFARMDLKAAAPDLPDPLYDHLLQTLISQNALLQEGAVYREPARTAVLTPAQQELFGKISPLLRRQEFAPPAAALIAEELNRPRPEIEKALVAMDRLGLCRRLGLDLFFDAAAFDRAVSAIRSHFDSAAELTVADASKLLNSSRKYVVPFLEYLDSKGITQREGNIRIPGRELRPAPDRHV